MKNFARISSLVLCLALLCALCACSGKNSSDVKESGYAEPSYYSAPANSTYSVSADYMAAEEASALGGFAASSSRAVSSESADSSAESNDTAADLNPEKIIYSASATVETTEYDSTLEALQSMIESVGGWVESSSMNGAKYSSISSGRKTYRSASYTLRVPNESFSLLMSRLSELGNVPYSHVYSENVTSQYYDTQARLTSYQAQEQRLIELLDKAESVSDVIEIENELSSVRYRIESLQTTLRGWDRRVTWSTIDLSINEVSEYTPTAKVSYGAKLLDALTDGIETLGDFLIGLVEALPTLLVLVALIIGLVQLIRAFFRKRPERAARRAERRAAKKAKQESGES